MKLGLIYYKGHMGDSLRNEAIRQFFLKQGFCIRDFLLELGDFSFQNPLSYINILNFGSILKKIVLSKKVSLIKEISWNSHLYNNKIKLISFLQDTRKFNEIDLFFSETPLCGYVASIIKKKKAIPYILDLHGPVIYEAIHYNGASNAWIRHLCFLEKEAVLNADYVLVTNNVMKSYIEDKYKKPGKNIFIISNGAYSQENKAMYCSNPMKIIFSGNFTAYEGVLEYIKAAEILGGSNYEFYLMGDGRLRNEIINYINNNSVNIIYLGKKKHSECKKILSNMQVGIAPLPNNWHSEASFPMKLIEYASCGLPIITTDAGEWARDIKNYECGIVVRDNSPHLLCGAIEKMSDIKTWKTYGKNGITMVSEKYSWNKVTTPLLKLVKEKFT